MFSAWMVLVEGIGRLALLEAANTLHFLWFYNSINPENPVLPPKTGTYTAHEKNQFDAGGPRRQAS
jgi:hypothetical protein